MTEHTQQILDIVERLPANKQEEVADFARYLLERADDARWQLIHDETTLRPRLSKFLEESAREASEPLDMKKL